MTHENIATITSIEAEERREAQRFPSVAGEAMKRAAKPKVTTYGWTEETHAALVELLQMLTYCRPDGSKTEKKFINRYLTPLGLKRDEAGNLYKTIGKSQVIWSSHTDTVHYKHGKQELAILGEDIKLRHGSKSNCLGADCTTGVWIMREMIKAEVPGLYIFHTGEERGGIGSEWIKSNGADMLKGYKAAIAFDRLAKTSIITHQFGGRCCSDIFADSLGRALGGGWEKDDGGSFTDTANYTGLVNECTNISVGYYGQHSSRETQNIPHAARLREIMIAFDESKLTIARRPGEVEKTSFNGFGVQRGYGQHSGWGFDDDDYYRWADIDAAKTGKVITKKSKGFVPLVKKGIITADDDLRAFEGASSYDGPWGDGIPTRRSKLIGSNRDLIRIIEDNAEGVADFLEHYGVDEEEMIEWIMQSKGFVKRGSRR